MTEWHIQVGENLGIALTRLAPIMGTLLVVSVLRGEYYAIPGTLVSIALVFGVG